MSVYDLPSVPRETGIFIDSNIFIYAFQKKSVQCLDFLRRCNNEEVYGFTGCEVINEVTHQLMMMEAVSTGIITDKNPDLLKRNRSKIPSLMKYWVQASSILSMNIPVIYSTEDRLKKAHIGRTSHELLTMDSIHLAAMSSEGIMAFATKDKDFETISGLDVYKPSDVKY